MSKSTRKSTAGVPTEMVPYHSTLFPSVRGILPVSRRVGCTAGVSDIGPRERSLDDIFDSEKARCEIALSMSNAPSTVVKEDLLLSGMETNEGCGRAATRTVKAAKRIKWDKGHIPDETIEPNK